MFFAKTHPLSVQRQTRWMKQKLNKPTSTLPETNSSSPLKIGHLQKETSTLPETNILLMAEILHHLGCMKPY